MLEATIEHIIPKSKGGNNDILNKIHACVECNSKKSSMFLEHWPEQFICKYLNNELITIKYELSIKIKNIKAMIWHVERYNKKLFKDFESYQQYVFFCSELNKLKN